MAKARKSKPSPPAQPEPRPPAPAQPAAKKPSRPAKPLRTSQTRFALPPVDALRLAALAIICVAIWCTVYDRWSADAWSVPMEYGLNPAAADVKGELAGWRAAQDGYFFPGIFHNEPRLNAPYSANWNDYPMTADFMFWTTGLVARFIGLFPAVNLFLLFLQVLAVLAFYYAARRLRCGWLWASGGALLYGLAPFAFAHSLHHIDIVCYWHMPLALLVCFWIANGNGLRFGTRDYWFAIAVAVVTGFQNVYYTNIFIQLVGISLIIQLLRQGWRQWRACLPAFTIGAAAFAVFFFMVFRVTLYALFHGHNPAATVRSFAQMEFYGLKLIDLFIPFPTHKIPAFAALGRQYESWTILPAETPPACYFGLVGIAAFLWLAVYTVRRAISRPAKRIPLEAVQTLWIFFYGVVGGVNAFIGVLGFQLFRSTTRFCIVLLAIALLFAIRRLSLIARRWPSPWPFLAPIALTMFGLWEFLPTTAGEDARYVDALVNSDRLFSQTMEASLPRGGMVFQLPVMDFPESPIPGVSAYDHYRPFLYTHDLRFSYGSDKGRVDTTWQRVVGAMPPAQQIAALERYGFSGIYINTAAYPDHAESLLNQYKAAGRPSVIESQQKDLYCVILNPSPNPELPPPGPLFAQGWYSEQDSANGQQRDHLANGDGVLVLTNTASQPVDRYANFFVATAAPRTVTVQGGGAYQSWRVDQQHPARVSNLHLTLPPGESRINFTTDAPPTPQQMGLITFDIVNFDLSDTPIPDQ